MAGKSTRKAKASDLVASSASPQEFRKTNEAIGLRVTEGRLTLLSRKIFNVLMYRAQELREVGLNSPINTPASKKYFWIRLADLARDARYDSKDTEYLKEQLQELQNVKLLLENEQQWTSERLIASVTIVNPAGLKKHGGEVWLGFAFPPEVHEEVMAPGKYTKFSIVFQGLLRSGSSLALYEICRRYATNPSKVTMINTYEYWYSALTGNPVSAEDLPEYKYFKRDYLKTSIAEINAVTDIQIELIEHKNGRRVDRLQFRVELHKQPQLEFPAPPVVDLELMGRIMQLGFSQHDAGEIMGQHGDQKIRQVLNFVQTRLEQKNSTPLDSPAAYFRWAMKQDAASTVLQLPATPQRIGQEKKDLGPTTLEKFLSARALEALAVYSEDLESNRKALFERFVHETPSKGIKLGRGIENNVVRSMFSRWYANELWGEPTVESLTAFVDKFNIVP